MTLRRLAAMMGFCFMLVTAVFVVHLFMVLWVTGEDHIVLYFDLFHERSLEMWVVFAGFCLVPITLYELDALLQNE